MSQIEVYSLLDMSIALFQKDIHTSPTEDFFIYREPTTDTNIVVRLQTV